MPARFNHAKRVVYAGDETAARQLHGRASVLLANFVRELVEQGLTAGQRRVEENGAVFELTYQGNIGQIVITVPPSVPTGEEVLRFDVWIPKGLVVVPANSSAINGWGLPVSAEQDDPLNPEIAPDNWTVAGAEPQVLLTRLPDAGYPKLRTVTRPMYYDDEDETQPFKFPLDAGTWNAYRLGFGVITVDMAAVVEEINSRRPSQNPLSIPFRGLANLAEWLGSKISKHGVDPAMYPPGSKDSYNRLAKDGTAREVATHGAVGSIGIVDTSGDTGPSDYADSLIAAVPNLGTDTIFKNGTTLALSGGGSQTLLAAIDQTSQWVRCGNIDWKSIHEEIPRLSWNGPRGRSVPSYEMSGGIFPIAISGVTPFNATFTFYLPDLALSHIDSVDTKEFDRFVYSRGRILAQLPNSGYCLGAAVQKIPALLTTQGTIYRLVVVAWHRADQKMIELNSGGFLTFSPGPGWFDTTSDIRIWYADMPERNGLACAPDRMIDDLYDETTNPTGWREIERYRLADFAAKMHFPGNFINAISSSGAQGYTPEANAAPKVYWQTWMFNGSGTEAVALRGDAWAGFGPAVFWSTGLWPSQLLRLRIAIDRTTPTPATSIVSDWEIGGAQGSDAPNGEVGWEMGYGEKIIGADYVGDTLHTVRLEGAGFTTCLLTSNGGTLLDLSDRLGQILSHAGVRFSYLDARSNDFTYLDAVRFDSTTSNYQVRFYQGGNLVDVSATVNVGTVGMWGDLSAYQLTVADVPGLTQCAFGVHTNPAYASTTLFQHLVTDTPWARYDSAYIGGGQFGLLTFGASWTVDRRAAATVSSMDAPTLYEVDSGWLKFAGVV